MIIKLLWVEIAHYWGYGASVLTYQDMMDLFNADLTHIRESAYFAALQARHPVFMLPQ